jgi:cyclophilin family peptidyl-prolyl cis-trans isomerase
MSYAFLDIRIGNSPSNRVIIQLFEEDAPETCKFFKSLLSHENGYRGTRFERVIEEFMIQGGDVGMEDDVSIPRGPDSMESIERAVDKPGLVGLARKSVAEINAQFFITLGNAEHLQGVHTIFGQVVKGMEFVKKISEVEVDDDDVPVAGYEVTITNCGELQQRKKWQPPARKSISPERKYRQLQDEEDKEEWIESEPSWRDTDNYGTRHRSPPRRDENRKKRSRTPVADSDTQKRHRHVDSGNPPRKSISPERKHRHLQDEARKEESSENEPFRGDTNPSRTRHRSPPRRDEGRGKRSRTPDSDSDAQKQHRHHHHRHHHHRRHRKSANEDDEKEQNGHSSAAKARERSPSPQRRKQHPPDTSQSRDIESNRGREYIPRRQERRESNYGRLGLVSGYDDEIRDDEHHLRDVERMREDDREKVEPAVKFKGRGAMKFLENRRREYRY